MKGKKLVGPVICSDDKDNKDTFLINCEYSSLLNDNNNAMLEYYINIPETPNPWENSMTYSANTNGSSKMYPSIFTSP